MVNKKISSKEETKLKGRLEEIFNERQRFKLISAIIMSVCLLAAIIVVFINAMPQTVVDESQLAAKVNNKYITLQEVDSWKAFLESQPVGTVSEKEVIKQLVYYELLIQEADKLKIEVTKEEIDDMYDLYSEMAHDSLEFILSEQNVSIDEFRTQLEHTILIQKLLERLVSTINVTDQEIDDFVASNNEVIGEKLEGVDLSNAQFRDSIRLTLLQIKKEDAQRNYIDNLISKSDIKYYNKFEILMEE